MRSLSFAELNLNLAGCIKDQSAIAFDNSFAEANAQTREANSTQQLAEELAQSLVAAAGQTIG